MRPDRRTVLAAAGAIAGAAAVARAAEGPRAGALILYDPEAPAARAFAQARGEEAVAIRGDRIRLARRLLPRGPGRLTVIGRHADVLLLGEAAREAGYRTFGAEPFPALADGIYVWTGRRSA